MVVFIGFVLGAVDVGCGMTEARRLDHGPDAAGTIADGPLLWRMLDHPPGWCWRRSTHSLTHPRLAVAARRRADLRQSHERHLAGVSGTLLFFAGLFVMVPTACHQG